MGIDVTAETKCIVYLAKVGKIIVFSKFVTKKLPLLRVEVIIAVQGISGERLDLPLGLTRR